MKKKPFLNIDAEQRHIRKALLSSPVRVPVVLTLENVDDIIMLLDRYAGRCDDKGGAPSHSARWRALAKHLEQTRIDCVSIGKLIEDLRNRTYKKIRKGRHDPLGISSD